MSENDIEIIRAMDLPEYEGNPNDAKMLVTTSEGMKQMSGEAYPQLDTTTAAEGDIPAVGEGGNLVGSGIKAENVAQKNGYYSQLTAGAAENLVGQTPDKEAYLMRPTGGESNEVANGIASVVGIEGNSCVWNQLFHAMNNMSAEGIITDYNSETHLISITNVSRETNYYSGSTRNAIITSNELLVGHKYYIKPNKDIVGITFYNNSASSEYYNSNSSYINTHSTEGSIVMRVTSEYDFVNEHPIGDVCSFYIRIIDLTLLGIDNLTTTAQVEAWLAQHVGTKPYYAYNAGEILSAKMIGMRTVGRNLLNPETKQATLIPYTWADNSNVFIVKNVPSGATATFTPDNTGEAVSVDVSGGSLDITNYGSGVLELSAATAETYVCFKWDGTKDNDVVPHVEHSDGFDDRKVYGKVNGQDEHVQCFPNGMKSVGSVHDTLTASEAVVKIGSVNMGTMSWTKTSNFFYGRPNLTKSKTEGNVICAKYPQSKVVAWNVNGPDKTINTNYFMTDHAVNVKDSDYSAVDAATFKTAMSGVMLDYELATPITYTDLVYRDGGIDTPLSEVLINMEVDNWGIEQQLVTPYEDGNPTSIPATLSTIYSMDAVEAIDTLQKTTYTEAEVHDNLAALLACVNTNCSEVLGGTFAVSDTATDKVFDFSFTPNAEPTENSNE